MAEEAGGEEEKKVKSVGISTYARVRCFFGDRESLRRAVIAKSSKENGGGKGTLTTLASEEESVRSMSTQFTDVLGENTNNEHAYNTICIPLIKSVLEGYKAILIAYGQTGSGKTFSLIGAKGPGQLGLLPRTCKTLIESDQVIKLQLKAFEAYSTTLNKIILYDLFDECNKFSFEPFVKKSQDKDENKAAEYKWVQRKSQAAQALWKDKSGRTGVNTMTEGNSRTMDSVEDSFNLIEEAHDASHFAKTGKNPESSRGHTVYVVLIQMKNPKGEDYSPIRTEFVVVDLAGSEGGSTLDKLPEGMEKTVRFLEGGVINYGLTSLKDMFSEMRRKGQLKKSQGNGLRKLLYPFMTTNTMMSIIFTLSPSWDNVMPTRATMKFAQDACKLKMKPIADTGSKNWQKLYEKLKESLAKKDEVIEHLQEQIQEGIDHHKSTTESGSDHMAALLGHIYQEQQDKVEQLYQDYGLMDYVDHAIHEEVVGDIGRRKRHMHNLLKKVFDLKAPERVEEIDDMLDDFIAKGMGMKNGYEMMCEMYDMVPEKTEARRATRGLDINRDAHEENRRKTAMWVENAQVLQTKLNANLNSMEEEILEHEEAFFNVGDTDEHGLDDGIMIAYTPGVDEDFEHVGEDAHADVVFEDIDLSKAPEFWNHWDKETQERVEKLFEDENNVDKGKLKYKFVKKMTKELKITRGQLNELKDYLMVKIAVSHQHHLVRSFREEVGGNHSHEIVSGDNLQTLLDLKHQVHVLENEKRVEKSLKLWGQMRLKMRDRKLKAKEEEVLALERKLTTQKSEITDMHKKFDNIYTKDHELLEKMSENMQGMQASPQIEAQLNNLVTLVGMGGGSGSGGIPDAKLEDELRECKAKLEVQEEQMEQFRSVQDAIENNQVQVLVANLGDLQQKYSTQKIRNTRMEGRLMEIRKVLNEQARKIESLTQQIFIILQFPKIIHVSGREGFNDKINGDYRVGQHLHCGRVYYKHIDNLWALRWYADKGLWIFDHRGLQHDDFGSACVECDVQHPMLVNKQWIVYGGDKEGFTVDPQVKITGATHIPDEADTKAKRTPKKKIMVMKKMGH